MSKHTNGAIRAAQIITGGKYGEPGLHQTEYGKKTVEGVADIIDDQTAAPELLAAVEGALEAITRAFDIMDNRADRAAWRDSMKGRDDGTHVEG